MNQYTVVVCNLGQTKKEISVSAYNRANATSKAGSLYDFVISVTLEQ